MIYDPRDDRIKELEQKVAELQEQLRQDVELWGSPASPSTSGHCTRCHGLEDGPCEAAAGGHGAFNCPGCIAQEASR